VGAFGGVGGFMLPTLLGGMKGLTGSYGGGFFLCAIITLSCLLTLLFRVKFSADAAQKNLQDDGRVRVGVSFGG